MKMKQITSYSGDLRGVALLALDRWNYHRLADDQEDEIDAAMDTAKCHAYGTVLRLITGHEPGIDRALIEKIIKGMPLLPKPSAGEVAP